MKSIIVHGTGNLTAEITKAGRVKIRAEGVSSAVAYQWMREAALLDLAGQTRTKLSVIRALADPRPSLIERIRATLYRRRNKCTQ